MRGFRLVERRRSSSTTASSTKTCWPLIPSGAEWIDVGKQKGTVASQAFVNTLLISLAKRHDCVVRLKGGDPFVFGRGGEK